MPRTLTHIILDCMTHISLVVAVVACHMTQGICTCMFIPVHLSGIKEGPWEPSPAPLPFHSLLYIHNIHLLPSLTCVNSLTSLSKTLSFAPNNTP
jgi:hypothetical protein